MENYDEILETLNTQQKQLETQFAKLQGAIEIVTSMKEESLKDNKESDSYTDNYKKAKAKSK